MAAAVEQERVRVVLVAALFLLASCTAAAPPRSAHEDLGGQHSAPESVTFEAARPSVYRDDCHSAFAADDVAGFVQEVFAGVASLQLSVDANPVRQYLADPDGKDFRERAAMQACGERVITSFVASSDPWIRELARPMATLLADARTAEAKAEAVFRQTDWNSVGDVDARAKRWSEVRPSTFGLSQRGSALVGSIVAVLREDGRMDIGPGTLRISSDGRETALRDRGRLTDLTIMVELGIDPGGPLSTAARKVLKWLYHADGLRFAKS